MKKSIRILSLLMAFAMLIGSFSVMGNAYEAYKDSAVKYNDVDSPEFTTEQYASMGLDEVDRMLLKEKIVLDIYIGTLNLGSIDTTLTSVEELLNSVQNLLPLLGDAGAIPTYFAPASAVRRTKNTDVEVVKGLFDFIANLAPIGQKYANGTVSLGIMQSFIADYVFDVRELVIGLVFGMTAEGEAMGELDEKGKPEGYDYFDDGASAIPAKYKDANNGALTLLQTLINDLVLGEWKKLDDYFNDPYSAVDYSFYGFKTDASLNETKPDTKKYDYYGWVHPKDWVTVGLGGYARVAEGAAAPAADYSLLDIGTSKTGYDFIEDLLQAAYNNLLIPVLNRDTVRWVREDVCGVTYLDKYAKKTFFGDDPSTTVVEGKDNVPGVWYNNPDYDPSYTGETVTDEILADLQSKTAYAKIFKLQEALVLKTEKIPAGTTLVDYFNTLLGHVIESIAVKSVSVGGVTYTWDWDYGTNPAGDNSLLFDNICNVAKFVIQVSGSEFFGQTALKEGFPTAAELDGYTNQQIVALVLRAILNGSVKYIYVGKEYQTVVDVAYRAVELLAYQDIPKFTYTKPEKTAGMSDEEYYAAVVDKMITILFDIAVYNLNQDFDMVPASGNNPVAGEGLLQYQGDEGHYSNLMVQIAAWAFSEYAPLLSICDKLLCYNADGKADNLTEDMVWQDFDTIIDALIPIKGGEGNKPWISAAIAGNGTQIVSKKFVFDHVLKPLYTLDATNLAEIFKRNENGAFASMNGVQIIIDILGNVFDLLFPGVFQAKESIDKILDNNLLGSMVSDLLQSLGTKVFTSSTNTQMKGRANDIILVGLPIICTVLHLSEEQEFEEMEIYLPETISKTGEVKFEVMNGSSGINTYHTNADGSSVQDKLYKYEIASVVLNTYNSSGNSVGTIGYTGLNKGMTLSGGEKAEVTLTGDRNIGDLIEFTVNYYIFGETGAKITDSTLSKTVYAYVGENSKDDSNITVSKEVGDRTIQYEKSLYLSTGDSLKDIEGYSVRVRDNKGGSAATAAVSSVVMNSSALASKYPFVAKNSGADESKPVSQSMTGEGGIYFFSPFEVAKKSNGESYERFAYTYEKDKNGKLVLDENDEPVINGNNGGVEDGQYNVTTTLSVAGTSASIDTIIHLYNDYGLVRMFENAVSANRQLSNYDTSKQNGAATTLFANYKTALMNAARLVLMPKQGDAFAAAIAAKDAQKYDNRYEELADALEKAIEALKDFELDTGIDSLKAEIAKVSGINYKITETTHKTDAGTYTVLTKKDIEYYESDYVHFGMRDYVPHTYNRYRTARKLAESIINSQQFFAPEDPREIEYHVATAEEIQKYNEEMEAYIERRLNLPSVNSIDATYATHMIKLTASRLIRVKGDTSKLKEMYDLYSKVDTSKGNYIGKTKENYDNAVAFAAKILAKSDPRPSEINVATTQIVHTWKKLALAGDYTKVSAALDAAAPIFSLGGNNPESQVLYTVDSYRTFAEAYNDALRANNDKPYSESQQDRIDEIAEKLTKAQSELVSAGSSKASVELKNEYLKLYYDANLEHEFIPKISTGLSNHETLAKDVDGVPIDGYIVGYGVACQFSDDDVLAAFETSNCTATVTRNEADQYSTGTVIQFKDNSGKVVKTYIMIVIGDVDGDGEQTTAKDLSLIRDAANGRYEWEWEPENYHKFIAADIDNSFGITSQDVIAFRDAYNGNGYINQQLSGSESCYVAK